MEDMLLRTCSACLEELNEVRRSMGALRREVRSMDARVCVIDDRVLRLSELLSSGSGAGARTGGGSASPTPAASSKAASPPPRRRRSPEERSTATSELPSDLSIQSAGLRDGLRELCAVEDEVLREILVSSCEGGELRLELRSVLDKARKLVPNGDTEGHFRDVLVPELRRGSVRATVFRVAEAAGSSPRVSATSDLTAVEAALAAELGGEPPSPPPREGAEGCAVVLAATFRRSSWPLMEAVLRWCRGERLAPRLELVHYAIRSLLCEGNRFRDIDVAALARSAPAAVRAAVKVDQHGGGLLCVAAGLEWEGEEEDTVRRDAAAGNVEGAGPPGALLAEAAAAHLDVLRALGGGGTDHVEILELLTPLRTWRLAGALGLPPALLAASGGALLCACNCRAALSSAVARDYATAGPAPVKTELPCSVASDEEPGSPVPWTEFCMADESTPVEEVRVLADSGRGHQPAYLDIATAVAAPVVPGSPAPPGLPATTPATAPALAPGAWHAQQPASPGGPGSRGAGADDETWPVSCGGSEAASSAGDDERLEGVEKLEGEQDDQLAGLGPKKDWHVLEQQAAFVECFKEELVSQRVLLLSQLNNLYKMRSGEELPYKCSGYEKLRDFIMDIPGLSLVGRGNRMQVRLGDAELLETFQNSWQMAKEEANATGMGTALGHTPQFRMPKPLPESLQHRLRELFLMSEGHEIPLKNFCSVWSSNYPFEQLSYRALGFRDVRGLLSNVPFIEKVGGKSDARYVLRKQEVAEAAATTAAGGLTMATPSLAAVGGTAKASGLEPVGSDRMLSPVARSTSATPISPKRNPLHGDPRLVSPAVATGIAPLTSVVWRPPGGGGAPRGGGLAGAANRGQPCPPLSVVPAPPYPPAAIPGIDTSHGPPPAAPPTLREQPPPPHDEGPGGGGGGLLAPTAPAQASRVPIGPAPPPQARAAAQLLLAPPVLVAPTDFFSSSALALLPGNRHAEPARPRAVGAGRLRRRQGGPLAGLQRRQEAPP